MHDRIFQVALRYYLNGNQVFFIPCLKLSNSYAPTKFTKNLFAVSPCHAWVLAEHNATFIKNYRKRANFELCFSLAQHCILFCTTFECF